MHKKNPSRYVLKNNCSGIFFWETFHNFQNIYSLEPLWANDFSWKFWKSPGYLKYYSFDVINTWKPLIPFNLKFTNEDKGTSTYYIGKNVHFNTSLLSKYPYEVGATCHPPPTPPTPSSSVLEKKENFTKN